MSDESNRDASPASEHRQDEPTELLPGGMGKRPEPEGDADDDSTLPMPKPQSRPDDDTTVLEAGATESLGEGAEELEEAGPCEPDVPGAPAAPEPAAAPQRPVRRPSRTVLALVAAAVVVACAAVAVLTYQAELWGGVSVPDVVGLTEADAASALREAGFDVSEKDVPTDGGVGTAIYTNPDAGARARRGLSVELGVGVPRTVPSVVGASLDDARELLGDAGITNLRLEYKNSDEDEGAVLSCSPAAGSVVTADEQVTLVVAQPYTVPDVVGLSQDEAARVIGEAGLSSKIEWQEAEGTPLAVLSTSPEAGERASAGATVMVTVVAPGASSETHVADYLASNPRDVSAYLNWKGWSFDYGLTETGTGSLAGEECAETGWKKSGVGTLAFTPRPLSSRHGVFLGSLFTSDVLAQGSAIAGVRFEPALAGDDANSQVNSSTISTWAVRCGLDNLEGTLAADDVAKAMGGSAAQRRYVVGYGEQDGCVWAILVRDRSVVVTCAPRGLYDDVDLSGYGDSLGVYLAYTLGTD